MLFHEKAVCRRDTEWKNAYLIRVGNIAIWISHSLARSEIISLLMSQWTEAIEVKKRFLELSCDTLHYETWHPYRHGSSLREIFIVFIPTMEYSSLLIGYNPFQLLVINFLVSIRCYKCLSWIPIFMTLVTKEKPRAVATSDNVPHLSVLKIIQHSVLNSVHIPWLLQQSYLFIYYIIYM